MAAFANNTLASPGNSFYALATESAKNWYLYPAENGTVLLADASGIQTLQAIGNDLFYNGELLAKAGDIQDIAAWSDYPAINNVNMDGFSILDISGLVVNNGATMGTLLVSNGITSGANITTATLQMAGEPVPTLGQITTKSLAASGQIQAGSISSTGSIAGTAVSGTSLATTGGLDMTNTAITRASSLGISNAGAAPYGALSSPDGVMLTWNGQSITTGAAGNVSQWANYPATTTVNMATNPINNAGTINATGITIGNGSSGIVLANRLSSLAGATDPGMSITAYQGLSMTSDAGNITTTAGAVSGTGNISTTAKGVITDTAYGEVHTITNNFEVTCDGGLNPLTTPNINLIAENGNGGQINISANPGSIAAFGGKVNITANGGTIILPTDPPTSVTVGGEVNILANTGSGGLYTLTSAVNIAAAGVNSYAGAIPPVGSLAGYNFIYGTSGVSLCAGLPSSGFQLPLTTYIYGVGTLGFTGVRLQSPNGIGMLSPVYATDIYPFDGTDLTIQGRSAPSANVVIKDCAGLTMTSSGNVKTDFVNSLSGHGIFYKDNLNPQTTSQGVYANFLKPPQATAPGVPNLTIAGNAFGGNKNYVNLANVGTLAFDATASGALTGVQSINGAAWPPPTGDASLWSQYPATSVIDVSGYNISNVATINGSVYPPVVSSADWSLYPALQNVDISGYDLNNVNNLTMPDNGVIVSAGQLSIFADLGKSLNIATNGGGDVNIGTGNAGDININTGGTGNDVTIGGDMMNLNATVSVKVAAPSLDMTGNPIINVSQVVNSTGNLELVAFGDASVISTANSAVMTGFNNANITATNGAVNIKGQTQVNITAPLVNLNANIVANGTFTGVSASVTGDVVSSSGSTPYSLNTIGALVNRIQQYDYWVAVNGSDTTGTGSVLRPFASVSAALAATVSISDTIPININLTAGTYTENPTMTRNNTFLVGNVGVADSVIVGTLTFNTASSSVVSQGMAGITVVGNVVCSESTAVDVSWYLQNCNITSYGTVALAATSTGAGNNSLILYNTVVTQNITANPAISINSVRLNAIQSQLNNTTTGSSVSCSGTGSMSLFGVTMTCAGSATASPIIAFTNLTVNGTASSFTLCTFTYTQSTAGSGKTAVFFNNSAALAGLTVFNQNVFNMLGSTSLILRPGAGSVAIQWGTNSSNILTIPAAGTGLTYTYLTSTPLRANALFDSTASAGTSGQVLTAGAGGSLVWAAPTAGVNNLGVSGNLITISGGGTSADVSTTTAVAASTQKLTGISYAPTTTTVTGALTATGTLKSASFSDVSGTLGTANQVLTAGTAGGVVKWASLNNSSLGAIPSATNAAVHQNQPLYYNTTTQALNYIAVADDVIVQPCPATATPAPANKGTTYIATSAAGGANFQFNNTGGANGLTANDAGWYLYIKNGNPNGGGDITLTGSLVSGNTVIHQGTALQNGGITILTWNGSAFIAY